MSDGKNRFELIDASCAFWFHDNDRVRTPFPAHIHAELKDKASAEYMQWVRNLTATDQAEVDDEELVGVFEMFLFAEAVKLVGEEDSDLLLTIHYPFLPRLGDMVSDDVRGPSKVVGRKLEQKDDDKLYMLVSLEPASGEPWDTEFLLPT